MNNKQTNDTLTPKRESILFDCRVNLTSSCIHFHCMLAYVLVENHGEPGILLVMIADGMWKERCDAKAITVR